MCAKAQVQEIVQIKKMCLKLKCLHLFPVFVQFFVFFVFTQYEISFSSVSTSDCLTIQNGRACRSRTSIFRHTIDATIRESKSRASTETTQGKRPASRKAQRVTETNEAKHKQTDDYVTRQQCHLFPNTTTK